VRGKTRVHADTLPTASRSVRDCERTALFFAFERLAPDVAADDVEVVLEHAFCARTCCCARHGDREQQQEKPVPHITIRAPFPIGRFTSYFFTLVLHALTGYLVPFIRSTALTFLNVVAACVAVRAGAPRIRALQSQCAAHEVLSVDS